MAYTTINKPSEHFTTKLYSGDSNTTQAVTGVGFQPDFTWFKARTEVHGHSLFDVNRGVNEMLVCNSQNVESTDDQYGYLSSFDSDGFTTQKGSNTNQWNVNQTNENYATWCWKGGGTPSSNTDGSITTTVSANTTAGFSVITYTGTEAAATIGHGLGATPGFIIFKGREESSSAGNWVCYHKSLGATKYVLLNSTAAAGTSSGAFNDTEPTSSVITVNTFTSTNSNQGMVAWCYAEKQGYSKFGSYDANATNGDGTFIYTGFKPQFVLIKSTSARHWVLYDVKRSPINPLDDYILPASSNAEATGVAANKLDFISNGIKLYGADGSINTTGETYLYAAFAENPLVTSGGTPATAK